MFFFEMPVWCLHNLLRAWFGLTSPGCRFSLGLVSWPSWTSSQKMAKQNQSLMASNFHSPATVHVVSTSHFLSRRPAQAEITGDRQLFQLILPHLTFFLATVQSCGFMSEEMKDWMRFGESWNWDTGYAKVWICDPSWWLQTVFSSCDLLRMFHFGDVIWILMTGSPRSPVNKGPLELSFNIWFWDVYKFTKASW